MTTRGKFITLEGIDGAGKSSHVEPLRLRIRAKGHEVEATREPGGTPFGEKLRDIVLHHRTDPVAEALVMFADRASHVAAVIEPTLASGAWVLCDRFTDSTFAYQCGGNGLPREVVRALERVVHPHLQPDATFLFDLDPAVAYERQRAQDRAPDRFEREKAAFFVRVRDAYLERAREEPRRIHVIDASGSLEQVSLRLAAAFERAFP
ncbi:MAG TPA: dTMP kinase [Usitatibacter sp.]|jgi:dTMP kinase|nr:dTMP kinase [Usitatibacter sp.]